MSYTSVYELYRTKVSRISELQNSHGSAPAIWDYVSKKLTGENFNFFNADSFWSLWKDEKLSENEKAVLLSTYDNSYIATHKLLEFSEACKEVSELIIIHTRWTWNHFRDIGDIAEKLSKKHDFRLKGMCIGCTSVSDQWEYTDIKNNIQPWCVYDLITGARDKP